MPRTVVFYYKLAFTFDRSLSAGLYLHTESAPGPICPRVRHLLQELLNQIHMRHNHAATTVALAA